MRPILVIGVLALAVVLMVLGVRGCIPEPPTPRDPNPGSPPELTQPAIQYPNEPAIQYPNEPTTPEKPLPKTGGIRL